MALQLDYTNMMADAVPGAITQDVWDKARPSLDEAHADVMRQHAARVLGFIDLPGDSRLLDQSLAISKWAADEREVSDVVVLGIGGSALGPIALRTALRQPGWNMLDERLRGGRPRLHVLDNIDPVTIVALLDRLALARTLFLVVSKSGGTAETMAQFLVVRKALKLARLPLADHIVVVTDPAKGALRPIAERDGLRSAEIPPNVGGRFSVLSPVGVLPAALIGINVRQLLAGARDMLHLCKEDDPQLNPALAYAGLQWLADTQLSKRIHVFMPYSDHLRDFAAWFVQLWAESLGKIVPRTGEHVGPTPVPAVGATDQHSQVQLFMEGPADKTVTFVSVSHAEPGPEILVSQQEGADLAYLGGHTLGELLNVERRATAGALARKGRPNMTLSLEHVDAYDVGALIMLLELATAYAGALYGVNAFDQPGVELGKQFTYAILGRPGFEAALKEWKSLPKTDPKRVV
ncbi:MAG: glucose-6-phosphate isomerase [Gemmatimonadaceae bacterium]